ncbi:hypothetical protein [Roseivirga sp.]|uniref:hypothetical protein n=1 Tax=Roseivirga sp. TaxID=1964215 RepID=UPI003B8DFA5D
MKNIRSSKSILLLFLFLISPLAIAQQYVTTGDFDRISKLSFGLGMNTYFGELRRATDSNLQAGLSASIGYEHLFTDKLAIRTSLSLYKIQADDQLSPLTDNNTRNLNFKSVNTEFVIQGVYYMFRHPSSGYKDRAFLNPYIHLGVGITTNNPKASLNLTDYDLRPLSLEGVQYGGIAPVIPFGAGLSIFISRYVDLQVEFQYTQALTGYLDDVSGVYRDPSSFSDTNGVQAVTLGLLSDPRTALNPPFQAVSAGTARGDGSNDSYLRFGFRLGVYLPKSLYGKSSIRCKVTKRTR